MEVILMALPKKVFFGADGEFKTQNGASCTILHDERDQKRHESSINGFSKRNLIPSKLVILQPKWYGVLMV